MSELKEKAGRKDNHEQTSLGAAIKYLRKKKNLSLQELSELAGCNSSYLCLLETGKRKNPTASFLMVLSEVLDSDLMGRYSEQSETNPLIKNELETVIFSEHITVNGRALQTQEKVAIIEILNQIEAASWSSDIFDDSAKILKAVNSYKMIASQIKKMA